MSALRKKVFPGAPVKCRFLYGLNNSDSVILGNFASEENIDYSLSTKLKKKTFTIEVLTLSLPYVKMYFQEHQSSALFFMTQITQILSLPEIPFLERSKITV